MARARRADGVRYMVGGWVLCDVCGTVPFGRYSYSGPSDIGCIKAEARADAHRERTGHPCRVVDTTSTRPLKG